MVKDELLGEVVDELIKYQFEIIIKIESFFQLQKVLSEQINFLILLYQVMMSLYFLITGFFVVHAACLFGPLLPVDSFLFADKH